MMDTTAWISWNEGLALVGSTVSGFEAFLKRRNIPVIRVAGGRVLERGPFLAAVDDEFRRALARTAESVQ